MHFGLRNSASFLLRFCRIWGGVHWVRESISVVTELARREQTVQEMVGKRGRECGGEAEEEQIEYEQLRNARLVENRKRMEELGLVGLSHSLSESVRPPPLARSGTPRASPSIKPPIQSGPSRRSSRLQGAPVVSYVEVRNKEGKRENSDGRRASEAGAGGYQPEIYTEEHEKLLGTSTTEWQLFVDGYGANGSRIYDPVRGKTCHQCRQKTMGHRTWCSCCESLHGQFCGDCLSMRYGENVVEAKENKKWVCPVCRKICNCSFCRLKRGWTPTGALYKRVKSLGYKSVAHYLILTRRAGSDDKPAVIETLKLNDERVTKTPKKVEQAVETAQETTLLTPKEEKKNLEIVKEKQSSLLTPKEEKEKPDTPEKEQEMKATLVALDESTSSEDGEGAPKTRRSRRSLSYISPAKLKKKAVCKPKKRSNAKTTLDEESDSGEDGGSTIAGVLSRRQFSPEKMEKTEVKRKAGRPRKAQLSSKASFFSTAPEVKRKTKSEIIEEPQATAGDSVFLLDSESDGEEQGVSETLGRSNLTIAQRLQRRRI